MFPDRREQNVSRALLKFAAHIVVPVHARTVGGVASVCRALATHTQISGDFSWPNWPTGVR